MRILAATIAVLVITLTAGFAEPPAPPAAPGAPQAPCCCDMQQGCPQMNMPGIPDLTAEQKEQLETIRQETQKIIIPLRAQIELKEIDLQSEMKKDKPDKTKIMKIAREVSDLALKIKEATIDEKLKTHSLLTPEQREKMKTMMMMHRKMMKCMDKCDMK